MSNFFAEKLIIVLLCFCLVKYNLMSIIINILTIADQINYYLSIKSEELNIKFLFEKVLVTVNRKGFE